MSRVPIDKLVENLCCWLHSVVSPDVRVLFYHVLYHFWTLNMMQDADYHVFLDFFVSVVPFRVFVMWLSVNFVSTIRSFVGICRLLFFFRWFLECVHHVKCKSVQYPIFVNDECMGLSFRSLLNYVLTCVSLLYSLGQMYRLNQTQIHVEAVHVCFNAITYLWNPASLLVVIVLVPLLCRIHVFSYFCVLISTRSRGLSFPSRHYFYFAILKVVPAKWSNVEAEGISLGKTKLYLTVTFLLQNFHEFWKRTSVVIYLYHNPSVVVIHYNAFWQVWCSFHVQPAFLCAGDGLLWLVSYQEIIANVLKTLLTNWSSLLVSSKDCIQCGMTHVSKNIGAICVELILAVRLDLFKLENLYETIRT